MDKKAHNIWPYTRKNFVTCIVKMCFGRTSIDITNVCEYTRINGQLTDIGRPSVVGTNVCKDQT